MPTLLVFRGAVWVHFLLQIIEMHAAVVVFDSCLRLNMLWSPGCHFDIALVEVAVTQHRRNL
eukprot:5202489-Amphidinium_carterae.1